MKQEGGPKRACTAYIYFTNSVREATQQEEPDAKVTQPACRHSALRARHSRIPRAGLPGPPPPADRAVALARSDDGLEQVDGSQVAGPLGSRKSSVCG